jgi:iron(III) transport system substrate-binding protein
MWKDFFKRSRRQTMGKKLPVIVKSGCLVLLLFALVNCRDKNTEQEQVVIYTSLDKVFSQPILKAFERQTGIKVLDVYDSEATKTTGLVICLQQEDRYSRF